MLTLVCDNPHCNAEATEAVTHPGVRWLLCADHAEVERGFAAQISVLPAPTRGAAACGLPDCVRTPHALGLCSPHYQRVMRRGLVPPHRRHEAVRALHVLPRSLPTLAPHLRDCPLWVRRAADRYTADAWARLRQDLHALAGVEL